MDVMRNALESFSITVRRVISCSAHEHHLLALSPQDPPTDFQLSVKISKDDKEELLNGEWVWSNCTDH